ncbi:HAD family hydrolase [Paractinoplanes ferrugineus]|uniref:Phosphoglycolate phosphatase n=1 Tax=Paractinoplanes ferrugineus TaxID=113564 RepID=A0A919J890_9ACTN|nr:HAD family phosphatase [Actinoplanes ferrugineus]GIE15908.1 phosphoglycolate phosphatase [Actinoplanes ferrugineus]
MSRRAVLFDLDGTLVDSNPYWFAAWRALTEERAADLPDGALDGLVGLATPIAVATVHRRLRWQGDVLADVAWLEANVGAALRRHTNWLPGALEVVRGVRAAGLPTGLVTSSSRALVDCVLPNGGGRLFDVIVTGDDVPEHERKPDPAPYRLAAHLLGRSASDCVAVEDSATGVASAIAAGCPVIHLGHTGPECCTTILPAQDLARLDVQTLLQAAFEGDPASRPPEFRPDAAGRA